MAIKIFWKFWKKLLAEEGQQKIEKLSKPHNLPQAVGREILRLGKDPVWVWHLKSVVCPNNKKKDRYNVRVFDQTEASAKEVNIDNYYSLNEHPELILFEGWYDRRSWRADIKEKKRPILSSKAA